MCAHHIYNKFQQVESSIRKLAPRYLYKYRTWTNDYHKSLLIDRRAWFAHPFTLNDPHDIRRPLDINPVGYNSERMFWKLHEFCDYAFPHLGELDKAKEIGYRWQKIQLNPVAYFQVNLNEQRADEAFYSQIGVFSLCTNPLSSEMWNTQEYSDCCKGYCLGFDTVALAKDIQCFISPVIYSDDSLVVNIVDGITEELSIREVITKYVKWQHEEEFRFLTYGITNEKRIRIFNRSSVSEVIIGEFATQQTVTEIISAARRVYGNGLPIYKVKTIASGLTKERIS